jgi:hypothetical protein
MTAPGIFGASLAGPDFALGSKGCAIIGYPLALKVVVRYICIFEGGI